MGDSETTYRSWDDTWKHWLARFWWLRGIAAAMSLAALVPSFIDITRLELLTAFHSIVVGWNVVCAWIGKLIGIIPWIPDLSSEIVSTFIFFSTIATPYMFIIINILLRSSIVNKNIKYYRTFLIYSRIPIRAMRKIRKPLELILNAYIPEKPPFGDKFIALIEKNSAFLAIILLLIGFLYIAIFKFFFYAFIFIYNIGLLIMFLSFLFGPPILITYIYFLIIIGSSFDNYVGIFSVAAFLMLAGGFLLLNLSDFPSYRRGFVYAATFVAAMEVLYALNTPWLANQIREFPCMLEVQPPGTCTKPPALSSP